MKKSDLDSLIVRYCSLLGEDYQSLIEILHSKAYGFLITIGVTKNVSSEGSRKRILVCVCDPRSVVEYHYRKRQHRRSTPMVAKPSAKVPLIQGNKHIFISCKTSIDGTLSYLLNKRPSGLNLKKNEKLSTPRKTSQREHVL